METPSKKGFKLKRAIQKKAFTTWANSILEIKGSSSNIEDLFKSLRNGLLLGKLIESLSGEKLRRLDSAKSRQQSVDNVKICLDFLEKQVSRVSTRDIDSEDIVDGCPNTTLELMWALITGLYIDKKELLKKGENKTVEEALLLWAQDKTKGYPNVRVKDFTSSSWKDGLAFLALISAHRPKLIHFKDFYNDKRRHNLRTAFDEAEDELGIPSLLDVEDMMKSQMDERSVASYVACFYKRFAVKQRRLSRSESSSDESDTSSSSETSRSGENRTERERRSRSTSKTKRYSRNKHRQSESSQSESSSSRSNSSDKRKSRMGLTKKSGKGRSSSSTASSSSESSNSRRGSKNKSGIVRSRSNSSSTPENRKDRKGFRNLSDNGPPKKSSSEQNRSDGKRRSKSGDRKRSTSRSLSRIRDSRYRRSHSLERKHSSDRSLSRSKHGKNSRGRSCSDSPNRRGVKNKGNRGRFEWFSGPSRSKDWSPGKNRNKDWSPGPSRNKEWSPGPNRNKDWSPGPSRNKDWSPGSKRNKDRFSGLSRNKDRSPGSKRNKDRSPGSSRDRDRSPGSSRNRVRCSDSSRNKDRSPGSSRNRDRFPGSSRNKDRSPGSSRHRDRFSGLSRNKDRSPGSSRDHYMYKAHVRESISRICSSSSQEDEPHRFGGSQYHTLSKELREKYLNSNQPSLRNWSRIRKEIFNLERHPGLSKNKSAGEEMDSIKNFLLRKNVNSQTLPLITVPFNPSPVRFEWQFQDEHGTWITYGKPNSAGNGSNATTTTSNDIENYFVANTNSPPVLVRAKHNRYILDFQSKTQTNMETNVQRPIRRIPKQSVNITPFNAKTFPQTVLINPESEGFEWQFEDEHGTWISFGKPNSAGNVAHITTTCSDDIEKHYVSNPANPTPLTINSKNNAQYVLDLKNMTQTNQHTSVQRRIRRVPKASLSNTTTPEGSKFVWSFEDEHDNWIKYGETSSSNKATSATTTTSDDIEMKYARNPTASLEIASGHHKYIIDFNAMTQTNINTKAVRAIRRQLVTPSDLPANWTPMTPSDKGLRVVALSSTDKEYINQVAFVKKTLPSSHTITKVFRIQNEHLWMDFVSRKKRLQKRNPQIKYKEVYLFHGTDHKHVQSICAENLDFRLNGSNGTLYGMGTYFATSAAYSANYAGLHSTSVYSANYGGWSSTSAYSASYPGMGLTNPMFIVKVLVGHYTVGNQRLRRPPKDPSGVFYDATVDNQAKPTIYVKYDNTEYYPEYYFEFT